MEQKLPRAIALSRTCAVLATLALIGLGLAWELWLAPLRPGGSWLVIKVLPLLAPLPGLLRLRLYTYRWTSLLAWLYVAEGAVRATSDRAPSNGLAALELLLALVLFAACVWAVRARLANRPKQPDRPESGAGA